MTTPLNILFLGDSIYNSQPDYVNALQSLLPSYAVTLDNGTYSGNTSGGALLDLADETYYYNGSAWARAKRGTPFSNYNALAFEYFRNDSVSPSKFNGATHAYDTIIAQGRKYFPLVVAGTCPPLAKGDLSAWDTLNDTMLTNGFYAAQLAAVAKYGVPFTDPLAKFQALVTAGTYTIAQLMRDSKHPTLTTGVTQISTLIANAINGKIKMGDPAPAVAGRVVNYLFGVPNIAGFAIGATTPALATPLARISGLTEQAQITATNGASLLFPNVNCTGIWVHALKIAGGAPINTYVDGTLLSQYSSDGTSTSTNGYLLSGLVADGLTQTPHKIEVSCASAATAQVIGITCVGVQ